MKKAAGDFHIYRKFALAAVSRQDEPPEVHDGTCRPLLDSHQGLKLQIPL